MTQAEKDAFIMAHFRKRGWPAILIGQHVGMCKNSVISRHRRLTLEHGRKCSHQYETEPGDNKNRSQPSMPKLRFLGEL